MLGYLLDLIYPQVCVICRNGLNKQEKEICLSCLFGIEQTRYHLRPENNELYMRFAGKVPIQKAACCFYFDPKGSLQKALHALKYDNTPEVGVTFGRFYGSILQDSDFLNGIDTLIPIPLHPTKLIKRRYNQSEKIASGISEITKIPVNTDTLIRQQATESQTKKTRIERWQNTSDVFQVVHNLAGHIALVDDVVTTGSTLVSAAQTCLNAGAKVSIIALATPRQF